MSDPLREAARRVAGPEREEVRRQEPQKEFRGSGVYLKGDKILEFWWFTMISIVASLGLVAIVLDILFR